MFITLSKKNVAHLALLTVLCVTFLFVLVGGATERVATLTATEERKLPIYSVDTGEQKVALGINCAWDADDIPLLIEILAEADIKASFFVAGSWAKKYPEELALLAAAGHEIGSHSNSHRDMTKLSVEEIVEEANTSAQTIRDVTGKSPAYFRVPSGSYNNRVVETLEGLGYKVIQWNVDSVDWKNPGVQEMTDKIVSKTVPGTITLFHSGAENTPAALRQIIPQLKAKGYSFVPVGELIYQTDYHIDHAGKQISN